MFMWQIDSSSLHSAGSVVGRTSPSRRATTRQVARNFFQNGVARGGERSKQFIDEEQGLDMDKKVFLHSLAHDLVTVPHYICKNRLTKTPLRVEEPMSAGGA